MLKGKIVKGLKRGREDRARVLSHLVQGCFGNPCSVKLFGVGAYGKEFYRAKGGFGSLVGIWEPFPENLERYWSLGRFLQKKGIPVPKVHALELEQGFLLMEDLGAAGLEGCLGVWKKKRSKKRWRALERVVRWLARMQGLFLGEKPEKWALGLPKLDKSVFRQDIASFQKYCLGEYFSELGGEALLCESMERFLEKATVGLDGFFCYRDFQPRNILWRKGPWFIDFQSAHWGPLGYDLASFLYSPSSNLNFEERKLLVMVYLKELQNSGMKVSLEEFSASFLPLVLLRRFQALGAYGRLALEEKRLEFLPRMKKGLLDLGALEKKHKAELGAVGVLLKSLAQACAEGKNFSAKR